jgi:hypothetical protein
MSRRKKKFQDIRAAKDRRAKKMAIGGAVLLVAVLAFEIPHLTKSSGNSGSAAPAAATTSTTAGSTTPGATATPVATASGTAAAGAPVSASASTQLPNSDVAPTRSKSQLYSFNTFAGKDPFVQQVSTAQATSPASSGSSGSSAAGTSAPTSSAPAQTASTTSVQQTSARTLAAGGVATISVNGKTETVRVGKSFPSANPVFRLVSLAHGSANIGIANGSYTSGAQTIRLSNGRPVTLVDTADGVRYTVSLISG